MEYLYELHSHVSLMSECSRLLPEELVTKYKEMGFCGLFVTDHWFNSGCNRTNPQDPWDVRVDAFMSSYEAVKRCGDEIGLDVFFGFEYSYKGTDFLVYGLDGAWMKRNPDLLSLDTKSFLEKARSDGGFVVQAHPFRTAKYIDHIRLFPHDVDGVEVLNTSPQNDFEQMYRLADFYADEFGLVKTAGSDTHFFDREMLCAVALRRKIASVAEMIAELKSGEFELRRIKSPYHKK